VIKFPAIRLKGAIASFYYFSPGFINFIKWCFGKQPKPDILESWFWSYLELGTPVNLLFRGVMANIWERRLYRKTKNQFLVPTYFSLLGLINVQKAGAPLIMKSDDLWCQIVNLTSRNEAFCDSHTFNEPSNFCWIDGHLMLADYGNSKCHEFIEKYSSRLYWRFSINYSWEEEKKKIKK